MAGIIAPTGASSITLTFTAFDTELNYDKLTVLGCVTYDCSQTAILLDAYSGSVIPSPVTSSTGIMLKRTFLQRSFFFLSGPQPTF